MKKIFICLTLTILLWNESFGQQEILKATELVKSLKSNSKAHDGASLNDYLITDINHDGIYEVIERVNRIEQQSTGLLNIELAPAFTFDKIYKFEDGEFAESYDGFSWYLTKRQEHYQLWKRLIENPESLSSDSQNLIKYNKELLTKEIDQLIELTKEKLN